LRLGHDFPDGLATTLLVVEAGVPVPWSKPADLSFGFLDARIGEPTLRGLITRNGGERVDWSRVR
jgi:hypothetical protein